MKLTTVSPKSDIPHGMVRIDQRRFLIFDLYTFMILNDIYLSITVDLKNFSNSEDVLLEFFHDPEYEEMDIKYHSPFPIPKGTFWYTDTL